MFEDSLTSTFEMDNLNQCQYLLGHCLVFLTAGKTLFLWTYMGKARDVIFDVAVIESRQSLGILIFSFCSVLFLD